MVLGGKFRVRRAIDSAQAYLRDGQTDRARSVATEALGLAQGLKPGYEQNRELGFCHLILAEIHLRRGDTEQGIDEYAKSEAFLRLDTKNEMDLGRCLMDIATTLHQIGASRGLVEPYIDRAAKILGRHKRYTDGLSELRDTVCGSQEDSFASIPLLRARLAQAGSPEERAELSRTLAGALIDAGGEFDFNEICQLVHESEIFFMSRRDLTNYLAVLSPIAALREQEWPTWADGATKGALDRALVEGDASIVATALRLRASYLYGRGSVRDALECALDGVARQSEHLIEAESSVVRMFSSKGDDEVRELALALAVERGDVELCVELMESSRLQVLPVATGRSAIVNARTSSFLGAMTGIGRSGLGPLSPITVNGRSALADRMNREPKGASIEFDVALRAIGGPDAWWWGAWGANQKLYWTIYSATFRACGVETLEPGSELAGLLDVLDMSSPASSTATGSDIISGPLQASYTVEQEFTAALGKAVIPARLRQELEDRYALGEAPLSLVLCGSFFSMLPMPLLGVTNELRLVETAVIRFAAPAILIERVRRRPRTPTGSYALALSCVDPTGELTYARRVPIGSEIVLGGAAVQAEVDGVLDAEVQQLILQLRALDRARPGIFYYAGHADTGTAASDIESGLVLQGGRCLTGDLLFHADSSGEPFVPFPSRALIAACNSAGARGGGSGEWFGLSAAALWAGSDQVIATNWNVWDCPFTGWFDLALAERIRGSHDCAEALRLQQVEALKHWKVGTMFGFQKPDGSIVECGAVPTVWAAYAVVGIANE